MPGNDNYSGQAVGNYLIQEELGSGEFGSVYRAQNKLIAERVVAIKFINAKYVSSQEECEHFLDEARVLLRLQHPYILPVFDIGEHQGTPYFVIEFAPTGSLRSYLEGQISRQIPVDKALTILSQVGQGLYFAHLQRVVHRDLKPDNILFNARGAAMLADFGIAVEVATSTRRNATITGTPPYMAPEQFQGIASVLSDQYALGCIAYELLTGRRPFQASSFAEWASKHSQEMPVPPRQLNPVIPEYIERAILRAMAKERSKRFPDVAAFVAAISPQGVYPTVATRTVLRSPAGQTVLANTDITIGRAPDNTYVIKDSQISGHHAVIRRSGQGYAIFDLKSTNKTFVNEQEVLPETPRLLRQGDSIRIGATTFEYTDDISVLPGAVAPLPSTVAATPPLLPPTSRAAPTVLVTPPPAPMHQPVNTPLPVYQPVNIAPSAYQYAPPPVMMPQQQRKKSNKSLWIILTVIGVLVLSCGILGTIGYVYNQGQNQAGNVTPTTTQTSTQNTDQGPKALTLNQLYSGTVTSNRSGNTTPLSLQFESENQNNGAITVALLISCASFDFCTAPNGSALAGTVTHDGVVTFSMQLVNNGVTITFSGTMSSDDISITNGIYTGTDGESGIWSAKS
jgi:serine/threonine protein kinase